MEKINGAGASLTIDPSAICCLNCGHSIVNRLPPPNIGTVRVCKLMPPTPLALRDRNGGICGFAAASPIVAENDFCAHFQMRKPVESEKVKAANETPVPWTDGTNPCPDGTD